MNSYQTDVAITLAEVAEQTRTSTKDKYQMPVRKQMHYN